jgi:trimethylamine--corrinoid protein Co-methyltransferase
MMTEQAAIAAKKSQIHLKPPGAPGLKGLSQEDCARIHEASLELLNETGVVVTSPKAQAVFADHGAIIDRATNRVCLPPDLIGGALSAIPSEICIPGRDSSQDYTMGGNRLGFVNFGTTVYLNDLYTGQRRKALNADVVQVTRVMDTLDSLKILISMLNATDKSPITESLHTLAAMLANTKKPVEAIPPQQI